MADINFIGVHPYQQVLSSVKNILSCSEGIIKIGGTSGTGKTVMGKQLASELQQEGYRCLFLSKAPSSPLYLEKLIGEFLKLPPGEINKGICSYFQQNPAIKGLVLIIDEAQQLDVDTLKFMRMLGNIQDQQLGLVRIILLGNRALDKLLGSRQLRSVAQCVSEKITLVPMQKEELEDFSREYLYRHNSRHILLSHPEIKKLYRETSGLPGAVNQSLASMLEPATNQNYDAEKGKQKKFSLQYFFVSAVILIFLVGTAYVNYTQE